MLIENWILRNGVSYSFSDESPSTAAPPVTEGKL